MYIPLYTVTVQYVQQLSLCPLVFGPPVLQINFHRSCFVVVCFLTNIPASSEPGPEH